MDHSANEGGPGAAPAIYLLTGIQAAGKSTVAQLLAERLPRSVHVHGDVFRRWIVGGRADLTPDPSPEAVRQLRLRHRLMAQVCDAYVADGFTVVAQDILLGEHLGDAIATIRARPLYVVVLAPRPEVVLERERGRHKNSYDAWTVNALDDQLRTRTARVGMWLDTSALTAAETVDAILADAPGLAAVGRAARHR